MKEIPRNTFGRNEEFPLPLLGLLLRLHRFSLEKEKVKEAFRSFSGGACSVHIRAVSAHAECSTSSQHSCLHDKGKKKNPFSIFLAKIYR